MIKRIYSVIFFLLLAAVSPAQKMPVDWKKMEAGRKNPDSNFVNYLMATAKDYSDNVAKDDSTEYLYMQAMTLAEKIDHTKGLIAARDNLAAYYYLKGKLSPSLNLLLKNQTTEIEQGDSLSLFNTLRLVCTIYMKIGDINMLHTTLNRRQMILDNNGIKDLKDTSYFILSQYNSLSQYYAIPKVNKPDSAEYFARKINVLGKNTASSNLWDQLSNGGLGRSFSAKGLYDSATYYYKMAIAAALKVNRLDNYYSFMVLMAEAYKKAGRLDSAFKYAYLVYNAASQYSYEGLVGSSSGLLATLYKQQRQYDSAVKYMTVESQSKDSISGQEALKSIQMLTSEQQLKELENKRQKEEAVKEYKSTLRNYFFMGGLLVLLLVIGFMYRVNKQRAQSKREIETAYNNLKSTQAQLVQSEKMASLGELTAGIAHEIQNPLNFVNNFSEVNKELLAEMNEEMDKGNYEEVKAIAKDVTDNEEKINHHGKRAGDIVKGMLQHSRSSSGIKELTDINKLADEYVRLAYHGLRAKDKSFNATLKTDYDATIGNINVISQDIGRVLLNLITNAFYATSEKLKAESLKPNTDSKVYEPTVLISTKKINDTVEIKVSDNGSGIPQNIIDKIFQPFFTTKPTGQGTGLGLSLAYDMVKAHGGELKVTTVENQGSDFILFLPIN